MERTVVFRELQALAREAATIFGVQRAAMIAGCSPTNLESWLRRPMVLVQARTVSNVLPRLKRWHVWVEGYAQEVAEGRRIETQLAVGHKRLAAELQERLASAAFEYPLSYMALGCEVGERFLLTWQLGRIANTDGLRMATALGHLRHLRKWPPPPVSAGNRARKPA